MPSRWLQRAGRGCIISLHMAVNNVFGGRFLAIPAWSVGYIARYGSPRDLMVLAGLIEVMNVHNKVADVPISKLAELLGTSKETVKRSLKWLADHQVISVIERRKSSNNVYKIHYVQKVVVSKMTPPGVKNDPTPGSKMTPLNEGGGVKNDPPKTDESPASTAEIETLRIIPILESGIELVKRVASDDGKVGDMIFGADPEEQKVSEFEGPKKRKPRPEINDLASYFVYHPGSVMSHTYTTTDVQALRRHLRLLFDGGLTRESIRKMIDQFFVNYKSSSESPVYMFASKSVQTSLMSMTGIQLDTQTDPVLMFMVNDFNRDGLSLPWAEELDDRLKDIIIMHAMDICYRYPELIAEAIKVFSDDFTNRDFLVSLDALTSLIRWYTGEEDGDPKEIRYSLSFLNLPQELQDDRRSSIRPASSTIASAIYTYRRMTSKR